MAKSPIPLRQVLDYLRLEDAEDLVPGSVRYVGSVSDGGVLRHYWSFPGRDTVTWACLEHDALGIVYTVPEPIRRATGPLADHPRRRAPAPPPGAWVGHHLPDGAMPMWVPRSHVREVDVAFVASFLDDFDRVAAVFGATPSVDRHGGGAGPCRFFLLELPRNRLAMVEHCAAYRAIHLHLPVHGRSGVCWWDDYFAVLDPLGLGLEQVFRQGGTVWKHRRPSAQALARTANHERRMWLPP